MTDTISAGGTALVAVATYNEIQNLPSLLQRIVQHFPDSHILVIDDGSPDGTGSWCTEQAAQEPRLHCIVRSGKLGLGTAHVAAMRYAVAHQYDLLITMDADLSHPPERLPDLYAAAGQGDVVIGSRYVAGGSIQGWPWHRHVMSRLVNSYARRLLRLSCRDCSGAYRLYHGRVLRRIDLDQIESGGYAFFEEILWRLRRLGATFHEVPICFQERAYGRSKINLREAWKAVTMILRWGLRERWMASPTDHS